MEGSKAGFFGIKTIIILLVIVSLFYSGYKIGTFYFCYYDLVNYTETILRKGQKADIEDLRKLIIDKTKQLGIPADPHDLRLRKDTDIIYANLPYQEIFYIRVFGKDIDIKVFDFELDIKQRMI